MSYCRRNNKVKPQLVQTGWGFLRFWGWMKREILLQIFCIRLHVRTIFFYIYKMCWLKYKVVSPFSTANA